MIPGETMNLHMREYLNFVPEQIKRSVAIAFFIINKFYSNNVVTIELKNKVTERQTSFIVQACRTSYFSYRISLFKNTWVINLAKITNK